METQQILVLSMIAILFLALIRKSSKASNAFKSPKRIENEERFEEVKDVATLWGFELVLQEASGHSNYVRYNVYTDGMKIGWCNSTADTSKELHYSIVENCQRYFPSMETHNAKLDKLVLDKKLELTIELRNSRNKTKQ